MNMRITLNYRIVKNFTGYKIIKMKTLLPVVLLALSFSLSGQDNNVVVEMDKLRVSWDSKAQSLATYDDLKNLCKNRSFRRDLIGLLNNIHHYDSSIYVIAKNKYWNDFDLEAKAAMDDITALERDFTTKGFRHFVRQECRAYNRTEHNFGHKGAKYEAEKKRIQEALVKYVGTITMQIDMIDDHAHHLEL